MMRAPKLRMAALATVVAVAAMLPLTGATAGPVLPAVPVDVTTAISDGKPPSSDSSVFDSLPKLAGSGRQTASCGPQLTSPQGLEAQTCTIGEDGDTWARTYYSNTTGRPLDGVLTLMLPDGRTVQVRCAITADRGAGTARRRASRRWRGRRSRTRPWRRSPSGTGNTRCCAADPRTDPDMETSGRWRRGMHQRPDSSNGNKTSPVRKSGVRVQAPVPGPAGSGCDQDHPTGSSGPDHGPNCGCRRGRPVSSR